MVISQAQERGCGYAVVKMALVHCSRRRDFAYAPEPLAVIRSPSFADLVSYAQKNGLRLGCYKIRDRRDLLNNKDYPLMVSIEEAGVSHLVYLLKHRGHKFIFIDPARGKRAMKDEEFVAIFTGQYLKEEEYRECGVHYARPEPIPQTNRALLGLCSFAIQIFILLTMLFFGNGADYLFPLGFLLAAASFMIAQRGMLSSTMKQFDKAYLARVDDDDYRVRTRNLVHYHSYKAAAFASMPSLAANFGTLATGSLILTLNDRYMGLCICAIYLLAMIEHLFLIPRYERRKVELEEKEARYQSVSIVKKKRAALLQDLTSDAYHLADYLSVRGLIIAGICIGLALFILYRNGDFVLNRFLFTAFAFFFIFHQVDALSKAGDLLATKRREEPYFALHFME